MKAIFISGETENFARFLIEQVIDIIWYSLDLKNF